MIRVTQTFLPPLSEYVELLKSVWESSHLTNRGPLLLELENKLQEFLGVKNIIITTNGTIPIQIAMHALSLSGEIITTPFSYIATTSSILWEGLTPVFVDIDPEHLTIDENKIEAAITNKTTAILATHVFGNPCNVDRISEIAKKHNLKIIYDAAHSFGVKYNSQSIFNYGDVSTCSFHATKLFHTAEGGALFCNDEKLYDKLFYMHNFGHNGPHDFFGPGINAKASELQGAMGLSLLPYLSEIFNSRKKIVEQYLESLSNTTIQFMTVRTGTTWNYSYFPIILDSEETLLRVNEALLNDKIQARRYFYPSLNELKFVTPNSMPISESISRRVLCLPLYPTLPADDVSRICNIILQSI